MRNAISDTCSIRAPTSGERLDRVMKRVDDLGHGVSKVQCRLSFASSVGCARADGGVDIGTVVPGNGECDTGVVVPEAADRREGEPCEAISDGVAVARSAMDEVPDNEKRNVGAAVGVCRGVWYARESLDADRSWGS